MNFLSLYGWLKLYATNSDIFIYGYRAMRVRAKQYNSIYIIQTFKMILIYKQLHDLSYVLLSLQRCSYGTDGGHCSIACVVLKNKWRSFLYLGRVEKEVILTDVINQNHNIVYKIEEYQDARITADCVKYATAERA
jgi:hypothetical protein